MNNINAKGFCLSIDKQTANPISMVERRGRM